jgi:anti-sigma-K factor RskA
VNVQEYISSGIIESYVLGLLSAEESKEFENVCEQYPEVLQARLAFEMDLEKQAQRNAIEPPAQLKDKIFEQFHSLGRVIPLSPSPVRKMSSTSMGWMKYAVAACLLLLAGSIYWNITLFNKNKKLQGDFDSTMTKMNDMENDRGIMQQNPHVKMATMKGTEKAPQAYATVYWDTTSKDVYLLINNLPQPASDKQYQLWALLDGKPIDGGLIDNEFFIKQNKLLIRMKNAQGAQAFAITLEKKGGNPTPQGDMYVKGGL